LACHLQIYADPDAAYRFDADADPDPTIQFKCRSMRIRIRNTDSDISACYDLHCLQRPFLLYFAVFATSLFNVNL
jgi:hypothetical protein